MSAARDYEYTEEEPRQPRRERRQPGGGGVSLPASFWIGAGVGLIFATTAVVSAIQISHRPRRRDDETEEDLVVNLTEAVQEGLSALSQAAQHLGYSFEDARRELIRFGLDPFVAGISGAYYSRGGDDPTSPLMEEEEDGSPEEWQGAGRWEGEYAPIMENGAPAEDGGEETHGED